MTPIHRFGTRTDGDGRWRVPGGIALRFGIPLPDAMPMQGDEYTFAAPDGRILRRVPGFEGRAGVSEPEPTLRSMDDGAPPASAMVLPVFGVMGGGAQTVSGHAGALLLVFRGALGAGLRVAAEAGAKGAGGSAALVVPVRGSTPVFALELGGRCLRPWSEGGSPTGSRPRSPSTSSTSASR